MTTTMFVRNNQPGPTVFDDGGDLPTIVWQGMGDPSGDDVLPVPSSLADNYNFQRAQHYGVLTVIEATDETNELIHKNTAAWQRQNQRRHELNSASLGQRPAEDGSVPREFGADTPAPAPKAQVGPGELPATLPNEVGVKIEDDAATPKIKDARVIMMPSGTYY